MLRDINFRMYVCNHDHRSNRVGTVHECDRRTDRDGRADGQADRFTMTKTALCIASSG